MTDVLASLDFAPAVPFWLFWALTAGALAVAVIGLARRSRGMAWRAAALAVLALALANPRVVAEDRARLPDVAVVVIDESRSMGLSDRAALAGRALAEVKTRLARQPDLEVRIERAGLGGGLDAGTKLFQAVRDATADIPDSRLAGVLLITDGQVHDVPDAATLARGAPVHALLTGAPGEADRRLVAEHVPGFGLVGRPAKMTFRVVDASVAPGTPARVTVRLDGRVVEEIDAPVGEALPIAVPVEHAGANVVEVAVEAGPAELSSANNRAAAVLTGVRDRLKVLLVSGRPHMGERAWRNLLKSDPAVDLVHFTILRPLEKEDDTPLGELALIAFPIGELFEQRINEFDLIVFDRYARAGMIPTRYLDNIATYVREGGALLAAVGPEYGDIFTLYQSPLGRVLPAAPAERTIERPYRPGLTEAGMRHPVTATLPGAPAAEGDEPAWGRWMRLILARQASGDALLRGPDDAPLLILDRVGEGRVALMLSDTFWLWGKGYDGGGPQLELTRRVAHWLMKEPELEEEALTAKMDGPAIAIERRSLTPAPVTVTVTGPDGAESAVPLVVGARGRASGRLAVDAPGLYRIDDGARAAAVVAGSLNPPETAEVATTDDRLKGLVAATGGGVFWLGRDGAPDIHRVRPGRQAAGARWAGLRANGDYVVTGLSETPLLPGWLGLLAVIALLGLGWWREGRQPAGRQGAGPPKTSTR